LNYFASRLSDDSSLVILDSDVIWTSPDSANRFWGELAKHGILGYDLGLRPDEIQNGLTERDMAQIASTYFGRNESSRVAYFGGEFIALTGTYLVEVNQQVLRTFDILMNKHRSDENFCFEEAHVLSLSYSALGLSPASGHLVIKRIWTQPLKYKNRSGEDFELSLMHIPAEKKYGFRRFYNKYFMAQDHLTGVVFDQSHFRSEISKHFGIPRNTLRKWLLDVTYAAYRKTHKFFKK
jgi:hypothetical protein